MFMKLGVNHGEHLPADPPLVVAPLYGSSLEPRLVEAHGDYDKPILAATNRALAHFEWWDETPDADERTYWAGFNGSIDAIECELFGSFPKFDQQTIRTIAQGARNATLGVGDERRLDHASAFNAAIAVFTLEGLDRRTEAVAAAIGHRVADYTVEAMVDLAALIAAEDNAH